MNGLGPAQREALYYAATTKTRRLPVNAGNRQVARSLARRGLVAWREDQTFAVLTDAGLRLAFR